MASIGGKNSAMQIISSGGSLAKVEDLRASLRRRQILGRKGFRRSIKE